MKQTMYQAKVPLAWNTSLDAFMHSPRSVWHPNVNSHSSPNGILTHKDLVSSSIFQPKTLPTQTSCVITFTNCQGFSPLVHPPKKIWFPLNKKNDFHPQKKGVPSPKMGCFPQKSSGWWFQPIWKIVSWEGLSHILWKDKKYSKPPPSNGMSVHSEKLLISPSPGRRASCTRSSLPRINGSGRFTVAAVAVVSRHRISGRSRDEEIHLERTWGTTPGAGEPKWTAGWWYTYP